MPTVKHVSVSVSRVFEELPKRTDRVVVDAVRHRRSIPHALLAKAQSGGRVSLFRAKAYSESGDYVYGAPTVVSTRQIDANSGTTSYPSIYDTILTEKHIISQARHTKLVIDSYVNSVVNPSFFGTHGYLRHRASLFYQVQMKNRPPNIIFPADFTYDPSVFFYSSGTYDATAASPTSSAVSVDLTPTNGNPLVHVTDITVSPLAPADIEHVVLYHYEDPNVVEVPRGFWVHMYRESEGTIPELHTDPNISSPLSTNSFPIVAIRRNKIMSQDSVNPSVPGDVSKIMKYTGIDVTVIEDNLKTNSSINDVDDAFIGYGTLLTERDDWALAAMWESFATLDSLSRSLAYKKSLIAYVFTGIGIGHDEFFAGFYFKSIEITDVSAATIGNKQFDIDISQFDVIQLGVVTQQTAGGDPVGTPITQTFRRIEVFKPHPTDPTLRKRISVKGYTVIHEVRSSGIRGAANYAYDEVLMYVQDPSAAPELHGIYAPLFTDTFQNVSRRFHDDISYGSQLFIVNAIQYQHVEWYQTSLFRAIVIGSALIFGGPATALRVEAAFAVSVTYGLLTIATYVGLSVFVSNAIKWIDRHVENEFISAALQIGLVIYVTIVTGGFKGLDVFESIALITSSVVRVGTSMIQEDYRELQMEQDAFNSDFEERNAQIELLEDAVDRGDKLELREVVTRSLPNTHINETPGEFIARTSTPVDLPLITNGMVTEYVQASLTLPKSDSYAGTFEPFNSFRR